MLHCSIPSISSNEFWSKLDLILSLPPESASQKLEKALLEYITFASTYLDEFLNTSSRLDNALFTLLDSTLFRENTDRMLNGIISILLLTDSASTTFITLMLLLHLGLSSPLSSSNSILYSNSPTKAFRFLRNRWRDVVPILMEYVLGAHIVQEATLDKFEKGKIEMPKSGWEDRIGIAATALLYEICRVERLSLFELGFFTNPFVSHLIDLVERTRDAEDETFNYTLIKLIIALNEQFMINSLVVPTTKTDLMEPLLPVQVGHSLQSQCNVVLQVLINTMQESKTFGENIIFILNRAKATADTLPTTLLILKILFLLFTTPSTTHYFYTNDLYILLDVFIRQLNDLGPESESLKHTFLRVLQPLLENTQLAKSKYKKRLVFDTLQAMIFGGFREVDKTTKRLVERNLRGKWFEEMREMGGGLGRLGEERSGSTLSIDTVAGETMRKCPSGLNLSQTSLPLLHQPKALPGHLSTSPPPESIISISLPPSPSPSTTSISSVSSSSAGIGLGTRRRRPPPPPTGLVEGINSRPKTPASLELNQSRTASPIDYYSTPSVVAAPGGGGGGGGGGEGKSGYKGGEEVLKTPNRVRRAPPAIPTGKSLKGIAGGLKELSLEGREDFVR